MAEITYQMVLSTLQTVGLFVGIFYYILTLRNAQHTRELTLQSQELTRRALEQSAETRQTQLFMNIISVYTAKEYRKDVANLMTMEFTDYDDFENKYGWRTNPDDNAVFNNAYQWLEGIGVLVRRGLIDPELVFDLMYGWIIIYWEKYYPVFRGMREEWNPKMFEDLEFLYNEMKKLSETTGKDLSNYRM